MARVHTSRPIDYTIFAYVAVLTVFGLLMLMSASAPVGAANFGSSYFFARRQLLIGAIPGLIGLWIVSRLPYQYIKYAALPAYGIALLLLVAVLIPGVGSTYGTNAKSWIAIGGLSFQPVEFAKLGTILFLAWYGSAIGQRVTDTARGFVPMLLLGVLPIILIIAQPDVGSASILFSIVFAMLFFAGARMAHLGVIAGFGIIAIVALAVMAPYRVDRLKTFLHPELDPQGIGYQVNQATLAIGSGGWWGLGFGHSRQKYQYLPEVQSDSIFAVVAEEMGFVITSGFLFLILLFFSRSLFVAKQSPDQFGRLAVTGIVVWFFVQTVYNVGAMLGLLPLTGVPLPFVSHGGTALLLALVSSGIILNISRHTV